MKKTLLLLMAAMCAVSMSAQKHIMRVWRGGEKLFETKIEENDSITFLSLMGQNESDVPPVADFTYENWRKIDAIYLYSSKYGGKWSSVGLPWADSAPTAIPTAYRCPNEEVFVTEQNDTIPRWDLAFNLCYDSGLPGVHMFGLWDKKSSIMRIYSFIEEMPNQSAKYCFYEVTSSDTTFIERDAKTWQPSDAILKKGGFNMNAISNAAAQPNGLTCQMLPITGTLQSGQVNPGWLCFELNFSGGNFDISSNNTITFVMTGVQEIDFSGSGNITGMMQSQNGTITIPGNKNKRTSGILTTTGSLLSSIGSSIAQGISAGSGAGDGAGALVAGLGVIGAGCTCAGNIVGLDNGQDKQYQLAIDFSVSDDLQFNGQLTSTLPTSATNVEMKYSKLFENILNNRPQQQSSRKRADSNGEETISIGAWNLKQQPVLYVCEDAAFTSPEGDSIYHALASFLDPSSIELMLNQQNLLFDYGNIDTVSLVAYDFAFVNDKYTLSAQPYYDFYGIPQDTIRNNRISLSIPSDEDGYKMFLLDQEAEYQTSEKSDGAYTRKYTGIKNGFPAEYNLDEYDQVSSPAVRILKNSDNHRLNEIGVAVIVEVKFKNGDKRLFAERFLPEVRTFRLAEAAALKETLQNAAARTTVEGIELENLLFDQQKAKALRVLSELDEYCSDSYPLVYIESVLYSTAIYNDNKLEGSNIYYDSGYGVRVREYIDEDNPGIVIRTIRDSRSDYYNFHTAHNTTWPLYGDLVQLSEYLQTLNDWDNLNSKLEQCGMYSLNNFYYGHAYAQYSGCNIQTQEQQYNSEIQTQMAFNRIIDAGYIQIYHEDKDGNFTLVGETY